MLETPLCDRHQQFFWLVSKLKQNNSTEFLIEEIQPSWLEPQQKFLYHVCVGIATGLLTGAIYGLSTGWIGAGIGGVTYGLILGCTSEIYPIGNLKVSIEYAKKRLSISLLEGLWWGLVYGLIDALICGLIWGVEGFISGTIESVVWGLVEGAIWGLCVPEFRNVGCDRGMRESAQNAAVFTLIGGVAWLLLYTLVLEAVGEPLEINSLLIDGVGCGLFFGIYIGGLACLQHFVLRLILWWNGFMPWNYAEFLEEAVSLGFLEREGGCYRVREFRSNI